MSSSISTEPDIGSSIGGRVVDWLDQSLPVLQNCEWGRATAVDGISAIDVLFSAFYQDVKFLMRQAGDKQSVAAKKQTLAKRLLGKATRTRQHIAAQRYSAEIQPAQFLFWPRRFTHVRQMAPVAKALQATGASVALIACQASVAKQLRDFGFDVTYTHAAWSQLIADARRQGRSLAEHLPEDPHCTLPSFPSTVDDSELVQTLCQCLRRQLPSVFEAAAVARVALESAKPNVLVVGNDLTTEGRASVLLARREKVATASMMHGNAIGDPRHCKHLVDLFLAYSKQDGDYLQTQMQCPSQVVEVCGAPYLDSRHKQSGDMNARLSRYLGDRANRKYVLVATSGPGFQISHSHHLETIEHIMRLSARVPEAVFVAKLHPKDLETYYRSIEQRVPESRLVVITHGKHGLPSDIFDYLQGCSLVLTGGSTVARESMLLGLPVITMDFMSEISGVDFIECGATVHVTSADELENSVRTLIELGPTVEYLHGVKSYLKRSFHRLDGQASQRCADALIRLSEKQGNS